MTHTIYALVDPHNRQVRYIGKTSQSPAKRLQHHMSAARRNVQKPLYTWMRSIAPAQPALVILQEVEYVKAARADGCYQSSTDIAETKWIKRFRRSVLNKRTRDNSAYTWDRLVNPGE